MPSLIYVREPAPAREDRLETLLDRIRDDDRVSYTGFSDADQLGRLLEGDLAILLAERFDRAHESSETARPSTIPAPYSEIVGRGAERAQILALLADPVTRMVTLTGPGGIGKSRLAIEVALEVAGTGRDVGFALLEAVTSPELVIDALARALGVRDAATEGSLTDRVVAAVGERDVLLVVDNMEHLLRAATTLMALVTRTPRLQLLITSRSPLRVRPERVFAVGPLSLPARDAGAPEVAGASPAVELFVRRAAAVRPGFRLTPSNTAAVVEICRALEGVPLAIELAAARVRSLDPDDLLARLDSSLALLVGARDLPERQRTLRATIAWSVDLLDEPARQALSALAAFRGSFTLHSAEQILAGSGVEVPLDALEALIDASLVGRRADTDPATYRLLTTVRSYAAGLGTPEESDRAGRAWIAHYRAVVAAAAPKLRGPGQLQQLAALELESENIATVGRALLDLGRVDEAAEYMWSLYLYLWIGGYLGLVQGWMAGLLAASDRGEATLAPRSRAIALYYANAVRFWQDAAYDPAAALTESRDLFERTGDRSAAALAQVSIALALLARPDGSGVPDAVAGLESSLASFRAEQDAWGQAMALVMLGRIAMAGGDRESARARFEESLQLASEQGERLGIVIALNHRGWARFLLGDLDAAREDFAQSLDLSLALGHDEGIAYGLEGFVGMRAAQSDAQAAGLLLGAAHALRVRKGLFNPGAFEFFLVPVQTLRDAGHGAALDAAFEEGRELTVAEALAYVRD